MTFFIVFFIILLLVHFYIGRRIIKSFHISSLYRNLAWGLLAILFLSQFLPFLARFSSLGKTVEIFSGWVGYTWLGFVSLIFLLILFRDLGWSIMTGVKNFSKIFIQSKNMDKNNVSPIDPERRQFIIQSMNFGLLGVSLLGTGYGFYEARRRAAVIYVDIPLKNLPAEFDGFKIVQFSDLHVGPTIRKEFVQTVVDQVNDVNADMIVFTGDLVDGSLESLRNDVRSIGQLTAPYGKYFITGNHEYYSDAVPWCEEARNLGFDVLINENRIIAKGEGKITLAGVTDYSGGNYVPGHKSDPWKALQHCIPDSTKILLAHQPRSIFEAAKAGYDLQLSGHTHGGQIIPWQYLTRLAQPYMSGLHKHENTWIYVNQGTGYWGPPLRIGARSEITVVRLRREDNNVT